MAAGADRVRDCAEQAENRLFETNTLTAGLEAVLDPVPFGPGEDLAHG